MGRRKSYSDEDIARIGELRAEGKTWVEVTEAIGRTSPHSVQQMFAKHAKSRRRGPYNTRRMRRAIENSEPSFTFETKDSPTGGSFKAVVITGDIDQVKNVLGALWG